MIYADSKTEKHINAKNVVEGEEYHCPGCGEPVKVRALESTKMRPHFYHQRGSECSYAIEHDMSEWHYQWQEKFPEENREIPLPPQNPIHRADVCILGRIIEFQHSPISQKDFDNRNEFYPKFCYEFYWVFDMTEHLKKMGDGIIRLKRRNDLFKGYDSSRSRYTLIFEIGEMLYWIAGMDDESGTYKLYAQEGIPKNIFALYMKTTPVKKRVVNVPQNSVTIQKPPYYNLRGPREQYVIGKNNKSSKSSKSGGRGKKR